MMCLIVVWSLPPSVLPAPLLPSPQALSAQEDLEKTKEELKTVMVAVPAGSSAENEHDEHDESSAEASAELSNEGVAHTHTEEDRLTEAQKNERVKQQLQVSWYQLIPAPRSSASCRVTSFPIF